MPNTIKLRAINVHTHLRDFAESHKEDLDSGTRAAVAGGFTTVFDMPNNSPPIADGPTLDEKRRIAASKVNCFYGAYLVGIEGNAEAVAAAADQSIALKIYLDNTHGALFIRRLDLLNDLFKHWPASKPIALHAEDVSVPLAIGLCAAYRKPIHLCHISTASEITTIREAKEAGLPVTCEVTPHHLFLNEDDASAMGPYGYMKPELKPASDVQALWDNFDVIDCIADDHAPHTRAEKESDNPPPGVPGLETTLPLMFNAVHEGRLSLDRLVEMVDTNPARIFHVPDQPETYALIDLDDAYKLDVSTLQTRCGWSPFEGHQLRGWVREAFIRGDRVYNDGEFYPVDSASLVMG